ncbi:MAG: asparaginase [Firmicutes bacterium]|nr:asparaginase [Bacillota bacterium]
MIGLVLTGGTIGSAAENGTINLSGRVKLAEIYNSLYPSVDFDIIRPIETLSENILTSDWERLVNALYAIDTKKYSGIVIAHGSDTLAYTSALIAMLFADTDIPVCLIAADYPLEDERSNGIDNLYAAISLIRSGEKGVFTVYKKRHNAEYTDIYPAARLLEADTYNDRFGCFGGEVYGIEKDGNIIKNKNYRTLTNRFGKKIKVSSFKNKILFIRPYPSLDYSAIDTSGFKAIVHYSYHAGTACASGSETSLLYFAKANAGKDIYFGSLKNNDISVYDTTAKILESGIIPVYNISPHALYIKTLIAYNQTQYDPKKIMAANLGDEVLPPKF